MSSNATSSEMSSNAPRSDALAVAADPPNVLLVVVDALRADYTAPYAADAETPVTRSLAEEGTVFERAISPAPWTLPSVTSLLTGLDPNEHGATARAFELRRGRLLQRQLAEVGYRCVHVSPTTWLGEWLPQGRGFDEVTEFTGPTHRYLDRGADVRRLSEGVARGPAWYATVLRRALRSDAPLASLANAAAFKLTEARGDHWLDRRASDRAADAVDAHLADSDEPFFLLVHLMDPHLPLHVPRAFRSDVDPPGSRTEREYFESLLEDAWAIRLGECRLGDAERAYLRTRYRDAVAYVDSVIGEILDHLDRRGLRDETLVALTADHGEHLGEAVGGRTLVDHQTSVRLPALRVPLVVRYPGTFEDERREDLVQPHYLAETIRATAGLDHDPARSLLPGDADARRDVAVASYEGVVRSHPPEEYADAEDLFVPRRTAIRGDWKLDAVGERRRAARIDWAASETRTVPPAEVPADVRKRLKAALPGQSAGEADQDQRRDLPADVESRLEDLGYR